MRAPALLHKGESGRGRMVSGAGGPEHLQLQQGRLAAVKAFRSLLGEPEGVVQVDDAFTDLDAVSEESLCQRTFPSLGIQA